MFDIFTLYQIDNYRTYEGHHEDILHMAMVRVIEAQWDHVLCGHVGGWGVNESVTHS